MAAAKVDGVVTNVRKYGKVVITLNNVLMTPEKLNMSPSQQDGLDKEIETDLRILGCELIQTSGILLELPQVAMATGQVLFQRFYYAKSMVRYPMETTAMACVVLASKIEEAPRKLRDVVNVFNHIRQIKNGKTIQAVILDASYIALKSQVIKAERRLLKELGFCCHVKHPHKIIVMYLKLIEADQNVKLAQSSWNYMNDALRTDVFVQYTPETIACACIWLAARQLKIALPESPPWYDVFRVPISDIEKIAAAILKLYIRKKVKLEVLESKVEEIRKEQQEARLRNKVQTLSTPQIATFSPASRTNTPKHSSQRKRSSSPKRGKRSGSSRSGGSRDSRSRSLSHSPHHRSRKKARRSHSRSRSRSHDRHHGKKYSRSPSPTITPPPKFSKNKEKGSIVLSGSRSRSRSPQRTYDKYDRIEKADRYGTSNDKAGKGEKALKDKNDKYDRYGKYEPYDKASKQDKYAKSEKRLEGGGGGKDKDKDKGAKHNSKYERGEKRGQDAKHEVHKCFDNGYEKPHKAKKSSRHRSRSHDRRR